MENLCNLIIPYGRVFQKPNKEVPVTAGMFHLLFRIATCATAKHFMAERSINLKSRRESQTQFYILHVYFILHVYSFFKAIIKVSASNLFKTFDLFRWWILLTQLWKFQQKRPGIVISVIPMSKGRYFSFPK